MPTQRCSRVPGCVTQEESAPAARSRVGPGERKLLFFWFLNPWQVLRNLSLLKILKSSNHRILELHNLAKRCWNSLLSVPKILHIATR